MVSAVDSLGNAIGSYLSGHLLAFNPFLPFIVNIGIMAVVLILIERRVSKIFYKLKI